MPFCVPTQLEYPPPGQGTWRVGQLASAARGASIAAARTIRPHKAMNPVLKLFIVRFPRFGSEQMSGRQLKLRVTRQPQRRLQLRCGPQSITKDTEPSTIIFIKPAQIIQRGRLRSLMSPAV